MASDQFQAKDIGLRVQKKLLSRMSTKSTVKIFIDDRSTAVLDNTYRLFKQFFKSKKEAEKFIKCIIKTILKIGILYRNNQFNNHEMKIASKLRFNFQKVVMTITSFRELDFSYDYPFLLSLLNDLHVNLRFLIQNHLKEKSINRLNHAFQCLTRRDFCDALFLSNSQYCDLIDKIIVDLQNIVDEGG